MKIMVTLWNRFSVLSVKCIQGLSNLVLPRICQHLLPLTSPSITPSLPPHAFPTHLPPHERLIILLTKCKLRVSLLVRL